MNTRYLGIGVAALLLAACGGGSNNSVPSNTAPTVSVIADMNIPANQVSQPIPFTIADEEIGAVTVAATSDNQAVLSDAGLVLTGSGSNRTIAVTPTIDALGDAFVTVMVTDRQGLSANSAFLVILDAEQKSMQQFTRTGFPAEADAAPELVNAVEFVQDADEDDFGDLFTQ